MAENSEKVRGRRRRGRRRRRRRRGGGRRFVVPRPGATLSHLVKIAPLGYFGEDFRKAPADK
jgi:hypothetical protein